MKVCPRCSELYPDDAAQCPKDGTPLRTVLDPLIGKTVGGRFRLIQRLGAGGMSAVYLARHVLIDRLMAIKTLRRDLARDPIQRDRFLREARAVNRINHDNIVEISDFGETEDGLVYLVMEYVPGEPLLNVMADGPFSAVRSLDIAEQCANALARAHQMGVIHRDLKPENILLVQRKDRRDFVKLLDFGIAKILDAPSLTGSQQIFGTPGYIAPEYIQSTDIDGRSDLYSLGCILYEMVTGALPFDYEYPGDLLVKHVTEPPVAPRVRLPSIEPPMEAFILRCLEKNPDERFRDAYHFMNELQAVRERLGPDESWGAMDEVHDTIVPPTSVPPTSVPPTRVPPTRVPPLGSHPPSSVAPTRGTSSGAAPGHRDPPSGDTRTEQLFDSLARALDPEVDEASEAQGRAGTTPYGYDVPKRDTLIDDLRMSGEHPVPERRVSEHEPAIPVPPALDGDLTPGAIVPSVLQDEPTPVMLNRDGLLGSRRWRDRFDAIVAHLERLEGEAPPAIDHAITFAATTLEDFEDAVTSASAYQEAVEALHERARDYKATLGRAIDQTAGRLSSERGVFEALVTRRNTLRSRREVARVRLRRGVGSEGEADALLWELAAVDEELLGAGRKCDALEAQLAELTSELTMRGEQLEKEREQLVRVLDAQMLRLQGTASALRRPLEEAEAYIRARWPSAAPDEGPAAPKEAG